MSSYKYYITFPSGEEEFIPCNDSLKWTWKRYKDEFFFRKHLDTELVINGDLFKRMWELEKIPCACNYLDIRIQKKCCAGDPYEDYFNGRLAFVDGNWNPEGCELTIKPRILDEYTCLLDSWEEEKNYLDIAERVDITSYEGEVVCLPMQFVAAGNAVNGFPSYDGMIQIAQDNAPGAGWTVTQVGIAAGLNGGWGISAAYCRVENPSPNNTAGWVQDGGVWVQPVNVDYSSFTFGEPIAAGAGLSRIYKLTNFESDNGIRFKDLLSFYLSDCYDCIVSDFFGINPDGTAPDNLPYQCAANDLHELVAFQSFEVIEPNGDAENNGGEGQIAGVKAFKDIWKDLKRMFNLIMFVDENGCLRIEHRTYLSVGKVLDLSGQKCLKGSGNYTVNDEDIPRYEKLAYKYDTGDLDFNNGNIEYDINCSTSNDDLKDKTQTIECFLNDVSFIYNNEEINSDINAINNITLLSTKDGVIQQATGGITSLPKLNGQLASANLIDKYWLQYRPFCAGKVNGKDRVFQNVNPKRRNSIEARLSCAVYDQIDPNIDRVKGLFGELTIDEMSAEGNFVEFSLLF